jgi:thiamine-phosphate diphosphorylase
LAWIHPDAARGRRRRQFPSAGGEPIGLYPIVDSVEWVERLLPHQPLWLQLRIKDSSREHRDDDIRRAIALAKPTATRLIVNDHWESALRYGAEGVHLGQDDRDASALDALERAGVILGISTHNIAELARAIAEGPSYLALGTVFHTTSKTMDYEPLGLDSFRRLRKLVRQPVVAIGGIHLPQASTVYEAGADGIAVISEIKDSREPGSVIAQWRREPSPPR